MLVTKSARNAAAAPHESATTASRQPEPGMFIIDASAARLWGAGEYHDRRLVRQKLTTITFTFNPSETSFLQVCQTNKHQGPGGRSGAARPRPGAAAGAESSAARAHAP
jgi:hypothetical protein